MVLEEWGHGNSIGLFTSFIVILMIINTIAFMSETLSLIYIRICVSSIALLLPILILLHNQRKTVKPVTNSKSEEISFALPEQTMELIKSIPDSMQNIALTNSRTISPVSEFDMDDEISSHSGDGRNYEELKEPSIDPEKWPNRPILIRRSHNMIPSTIPYPSMIHEELMRPLRIHNFEHPALSVIDIDTELFIGKAYLLLADLPDSPCEYFKKKNRRFQSVIQGQFRQRLPFSAVNTGQIFPKALKNLPPKWVLTATMAMVSRIQPALQARLTGDAPYLLSPLIATSQTVVVSQIGSEPSILVDLQPLEEDISLVNSSEFGLPGAKAAARVKKRKSFFSRRANLEKYEFDPSLVYTFDFYQHLVSLGTFFAELGFARFDLLRVIDQSPIQVMSVAWDPESQGTDLPLKPAYLYNFEVWHERGLPKKSAPALDTLDSTGSDASNTLVGGTIVAESF